MRPNIKPRLRMYVSPEPQVSSEYELVETLKQIWSNKNCITPQDLEKLKLFTNKGLYDQISS
jgi:hypothetical protein